MPILLRNVRLELDEPEEQLLQRAAERLRVRPEHIRHWAPVFRSIDARDKGDIHLLYQVELTLGGGRKDEAAAMRRQRVQDAAWIDPPALHEPVPGHEPLPGRPVVVGFGPGGMFAALRLAERGYRPIVLERGRDVRRRHHDVMHRFYRLGDFDPTSNLLYGEGGAGTYSDGKLYTRVHDPLGKIVLETLYHHGADADILVEARPHIGSDRLPRICWNIREHIKTLGGEVLFEHTVEDVRIEEGRLAGIAVREGTAGGRRWIEGPLLVLAVGHSARDTIRMLAARGVRIDAKPFQIGVRIEHPQALVDRWQYGSCAGHQRLGPAEYHLVAKGASPLGGDMFSFCMCPGGIILPTNESAGLVATNGASKSRRASPFANSGLVITLDVRKMGLDALGGLEYQRSWERRAFEATGGTYKVPAQRASDFLARRASEGTLETSYPLGGRWTDIRGIIPAEVATALERALAMLGARFAGFAGDQAVITGPETRASSPVRIVRDRESREALGVERLYPVGEGAGYAGGIISAAIDGIKTADKIIERYAVPAAVV